MLKIIKKLRWLYPGIEIKRWIFLTAAGMAAIVFGAVRLVKDAPLFLRSFDILLIFVGITFIITGIRSMVHSFLSIFSCSPGDDLVNVVYKERLLQRGPKIVTIGGGHGLAALLLGLKEYSANLSAIVTVADSGGSSGRLREEFDILPPGDIRNCLVSLADSPSLMGELFQFRFQQDSELKGHNFGNLFITAMTKVTGDFKRAVEESSKVLAVRGRVLPSTLCRVSLVAEYQDGSSVEGEADIPAKELPIKRVYLKLVDPGQNKDIQPNADAIDAIRQAQLIVIGPGSLYTSILPNLVIKDLAKAIVESSALKMYVCNVMTQHGETDDYSASRHLGSLVKHAHPKITDCCIVNTKIPPESLLVRYRSEKSYPTKADIAKIRRMGYKVIEGDLIHATDFVRHDSRKLAKAIIDTFHRETVRKTL